MKRYFPGLSLMLAALSVLSSCSDDVLSDAGFETDDGTVRFAMVDGGASRSTRSADPRSAQPIESLAQLGYAFIGQPGDSLWIVASETDNHRAGAAKGEETRGMPTLEKNFESFRVTAFTESGSLYMDNVLCTRISTGADGRGWFNTSDKYYWPTDRLNFYALSENDAVSASDLEMKDGKIRMDYVVPNSTDGDPASKQPDFLLATGDSHRSDADVVAGRAPLTFSHPLASLLFTADDALTMQVTGIEVAGLHCKGSLEYDSRLDNTVSRVKWTLASEKDTYKQDIEIKDNKLVTKPVTLNNNITVNALCEPLMLLPQEIPDDATITVRYNGINGEQTVTKNLKDLLQGELKAGKVMTINLTQGNPIYPPVRDLAGACGNNTVSLKWNYPDPNELESYVHQIGVKVRIEQKNNKNPSLPTKICEKDFLVNGWELDNFKLDVRELDLFANISDGKDDDGEPCTIDTKQYNEFFCTVYALYINDHDTGATKISHQSKGVSVTLVTVETSSDKVAFFIPGGRDTEEPWTDGPNKLLDDDDRAAAYWFHEAFNDGVFVNADNFEEEYAGGNGFQVLWFPCGVKLTDQKATQAEVDDANAKLAAGVAHLSYDEFLGVFDGGALNTIKNRSNVYNDDGIIKLYDPSKNYVTKEDIKCIHEFYKGGGNLLLTTFALELVYDFGVIADWWWGSPDCDENRDPNYQNEWRPYFRLFNEVKQPATWFINARFDGRNLEEHPMYTGFSASSALLKASPELMPDYLEDYSHYQEADWDHGGPRDPSWPLCDNNWQNIWNNRDIMIKDAPRIVVGVRGLTMYPLLSRDALTCENNNVVWDFNNQGGKKINDLEVVNEQANDGALCLGTWGQLDNADIGVAAEFYPGINRFPGRYASQISPDYMAGSTNWQGQRHGRAIVIGLGAYEFNNGMKFDPNGQVLNKYQSNVQRLTKNAIEYLVKSLQHKEEKDWWRSKTSAPKRKTSASAPKRTKSRR